MTFLAPYADQILFVMACIFTSALLPTIYYQLRVRECSVPLSTVGLNLGALVLAFTAYSSLGLWAATSMAIVNGVVWGIVGAQRVIYKKATLEPKVEGKWLEGHLACQTREERQAYQKRYLQRRTK